jgi:tripartite-type tricarboxylate transporter receptor subunit TctC
MLCLPLIDSRRRNVIPNEPVYFSRAFWGDFSVAWFVRLLALVLAACCPAPVFAQSPDYPSHPVRIVVPLAAGGNLDIVARTVAEQIAKSVGQPVLVENRPGASSLVGTQFVAKAAPDGYILLAVANTFVTVPLTVQSPGYDPLKDFTGVTLTCLVPQVLIVNPALAARSVSDLIALAKAEPGKIAYGSAGNGSTGHMAAELFSRQAGIRMLHVPYKGNSQALVDLIGGQIAMMFDQVSTSAPQIKAGKVRPLAVTSLKRSPLLPEVPTVDESGLAGFEDITFNGLVAPAGTPREVLVRLNRAVAGAVSEPDLYKRFIERGIELKASASPEEFAAQIRAEAEKKGRLAREAGIKPE